MAAASARPPVRERGFALLIVLWTLVLLSLLVSAMAASGSLRTRQAGDLRRNAQLEAAADGGIDLAAFHLLDPSLPPAGGHWFADGREHRVRQAGGLMLSIRLFNEAGKINPNRAQAPLLAALLQAAGADARTAAGVATNIVAWRFFGSAGADYQAAGRDYLPPGGAFESLGELGLVLGMTPKLLAVVTPHLSLYHDGDPDPTVADPVVRSALLLLSSNPNVPVPAGTTQGPPDESAVTMVVDAEDGAGHRFRRRAIVLAGAGNAGGSGGQIGGAAGAADGRPFRVMSWDAPAA